MRAAGEATGPVSCARLDVQIRARALSGRSALTTVAPNFSAVTGRGGRRFGHCSLHQRGNRCQQDLRQASNMLQPRQRATIPLKPRRDFFIAYTIHATEVLCASRVQAPLCRTLVHAAGCARSTLSSVSGGRFQSHHSNSVASPRPQLTRDAAIPNSRSKTLQPYYACEIRSFVVPGLGGGGATQRRRRSGKPIAHDGSG